MTLRPLSHFFVIPCNSFFLGSTATLILYVIMQFHAGTKFELYAHVFVLSLTAIRLYTPWWTMLFWLHLHIEAILGAFSLPELTLPPLKEINHDYPKPVIRGINKNPIMAPNHSMSETHACNWWQNMSFQQTEIKLALPYHRGQDSNMSTRHPRQLLIGQLIMLLILPMSNTH